MGPVCTAGCLVVGGSYILYFGTHMACIFCFFYLVYVLAGESERFSTCSIPQSHCVFGLNSSS